ncbi:MAG TPA: hypothetical protein VGD78_20795 [Chthoniobacterales bacterium]
MVFKISLTHTLGPHARPVDGVFKHRQGIWHVSVKGNLSAGRIQVLVDAVLQGIGIVPLYGCFVDVPLPAGTQRSPRSMRPSPNA